MQTVTFSGNSYQDSFFFPIHVFQLADGSRNAETLENPLLGPDQ